MFRGKPEVQEAAVQQLMEMMTYIDRAKERIKIVKPMLTATQDEARLDTIYEGLHKINSDIAVMYDRAVKVVH